MKFGKSETQSSDSAAAVTDKFNEKCPKGPFRIYDLGAGGFDPNGRSKTITPPLKMSAGF